ncbi:MAG: helix-turn-helix domain-containing protein [Clostridiales Family XIII bacterium]|nr:helix-turn-helix domain-containing protein [Clostridiales Family XIII bacterium]
MRVRKPEVIDESNEVYTRIAAVSDALAHPLRIEIYRMVLECNRNRIPVRNKDIVKRFPHSQATISQHMQKLAYAGLVTAKKEGTSSYYYANIGVIEKYARELRQIT